MEENKKELTEREKQLEIESEISSTLLALKKAQAIYRDLMEDCYFTKSDVTDTDLRFYQYDFDNISHKGLAVIDYLGEAIKILENIEV